MGEAVPVSVASTLRTMGEAVPVSAASKHSGRWAKQFRFPLPQNTQDDGRNSSSFRCFKTLRTTGESVPVSVASKHSERWAKQFQFPLLKNT
jgi:hypothetical protein